MKNELNVRCIMSKDTLTVTGSDQAVYVLVDIKAGSKTASGTIAANIGMVLDRSGSMDGEKMENMKDAVGYVVDHLGDGELVTVTIFDDQVETLAPKRAEGSKKHLRYAPCS